MPPGYMTAIDVPNLLVHTWNALSSSSTHLRRLREGEDFEANNTEEEKLAFKRLETTCDEMLLLFQKVAMAILRADKLNPQLECNQCHDLRRAAAKFSAEDELAHRWTQLELRAEELVVQVRQERLAKIQELEQIKAN